MRVHSALKRITSANMRQNRGLTRLLRCANTLFKSVPLHSSALPFLAPGTLTENDMSEGTVSTPRSANSLIRLGYVRSLNTKKPVSTPYVTRPCGVGSVMSTVWVWPPK